MDRLGGELSTCHLSKEHQRIAFGLFTNNAFFRPSCPWQQRDRWFLSTRTKRSLAGWPCVCLPFSGKLYAVRKNFETDFCSPVPIFWPESLIVLGYWVSLKWFVHRAPVRPDIVSLIHHEVAKNRRQPYCVSEPAGHQVCTCSTKNDLKAMLIWRV